MKLLFTGLLACSAVLSGTGFCFAREADSRVAVARGCRAAGGAAVVSDFPLRCVCTTASRVMTFYADNAFYRCNETIGRLSGPVRFDGEALLLPLGDAVRIFGGTAAEREIVTTAAAAPDKEPPEGTTAPAPARSGVPDTVVSPGDSALARNAREQMIRTIVIDPGHGGKDPGAIGPSGTREKEVVLGIGLRLRELLESGTDLTVFLTRDDDTFIPLGRRTKFANEKKADIFISIHANSIPGSRRRRAVTRGYKVYFLSQAKNEADKLVAMKENSVIELEESSGRTYDVLQNVLIEMAGNEYLRESQELSILLAETFAASLSSVKKLHLGVGQANFWVLNGAYMPSVLVEAGFISNPQEEKIIASDAFHREAAGAIVNAIIEFKKRFEAGL